MVDAAPDELPSLLSQAAYARSRGWSPQYVSKLIQQGKIALVGGKVDPVAADAGLALLTDSNREAVRQANAQRRENRGESIAASARAYVESPLSKATVDDKTFSARLKQLELEERAGRLCETARVIKAVGDNQAATAQMLDQMVERCFARLAAENDPVKVRLILQGEIREVRSEIARFAESLPERITATEQ